MDGGYISVVIITGFLGSGKTTLLRHWLEQPSFQKTIVIVNEFGKVGLDQRVLRRVEENTILLGGGCACCQVRADLVNELGRIIDLRDQGETEVDQVVIETSGLADPAPILFSIMTDSMLRHHYKVKHVVSCLDSVNGKLHLENGMEAVKQIAVADRVILTKTDLAQEEEKQELYTRIYEINPMAAVLEAVYGEIPPEKVFGNEIYGKQDLIRLHSKVKSESVHTTGVRTISIGFEKPLNWAAFGIWLSALLYAHGEAVYRVKGILDTGEEGPVLLNGVQHIIHPPQHLDSWNEEEHQSSLVFIMRDIDPELILKSLKAFQSFIGSKAEIREICLELYNES